MKFLAHNLWEEAVQSSIKFDVDQAADLREEGQEVNSLFREFCAQSRNGRVSVQQVIKIKETRCTFKRETQG